MGASRLCIVVTILVQNLWRHRFKTITYGFFQVPLDSPHAAGSLVSLYTHTQTQIEYEKLSSNRTIGKAKMAVYSQ